MTDDEFVRAFESCELSPDLFHHRDHFRLARIYVDRHGTESAAERFRTYLRKFAAHIGKSDKYHETITVAWMKLVAHSTINDPGHLEKLFDKNYMEKFYSPELLATDAARMSFVDPDRAALPLHEPRPQGAVKTK